MNSSQTPEYPSCRTVHMDATHIGETCEDCANAVTRIPGSQVGAESEVGVDDQDELRWPHDEFLHGWWIEPGVVLAGEYPGARLPEVAASRVNLLVDHGIRTFVDLTTPEDRLEPYAEHVERAAARRGLDLRRVEHPIPDMDVIDVDGYDPILATIRNARGRGGVYVHCWGGIGRTSTVVGCLLVESGLDADEALADIDRRRSVTRKAHRPAPQTPAQIDIIRARAAQR